MPKAYASIDLKSFYASVECVERGLNPLTTNLVVADASRTDKTICLAISPSLKAKFGLPGRARLFEVKQRVRNTPFIIATPRMQYYIDYSATIYNIYLKYLAPDDLFAYSIDEVFCDLTSYLKLYQLSPAELVTKMLTDVYQTTGITATAGIGTNLFLSKIAMDILAKHAEPNSAGVRIAELDELSFRQKLWPHRPITDFWRIGPGIAKTLHAHCIYTMGDLARCSLSNPELLYQLFGVNAELLIDHAWGYESATIPEIKSYKPTTKSLSSGQVLHSPYPVDKARIVTAEMADAIALDLAVKHLVTDQLVLHISYDQTSLQVGQTPPNLQATKIDRFGRRVPKSAHATLRLPNKTNLMPTIHQNFLRLYDQIVEPKYFVRRLNLGVGNLTPADSLPDFQQTSLFADDGANTSAAISNDQLARSAHMQDAILAIRQKYGPNAILKGINFEDGATAISRHRQIGGHRA